MTVTSVLLAVFWLVILPVLTGSGFVAAGEGFVKKLQKNSISPFKEMGLIIWSWFFGQLLLWCVFHCLAVYHAVAGKNLQSLKTIYLAVIGVITLASVGASLISAVKGRRGVRMAAVAEKGRAAAKGAGTGNSGSVRELLTILVLVIAVVQAILQCTLAYMEADDSYYVAEATSSVTAERFYAFSPYSGVSTTFDARHGLAPFPIWISLISVLCRANTAAVAHVIIPVFFLLLTYCVYAVFGASLLGEKKEHLPLYMLFTEILVMFGFYSYMTPEKFFITRLREGKATIASLIIPGIIICLYLILRELKEEKKTDLRLYILLFLLNGAGCLCSTLGALLCLIPIVVCGILGAIMFRKIRHLPLMAAACLPCGVYALLYVFSDKLLMLNI